jgi:hypothetical protein
LVDEPNDSIAYEQVRDFGSFLHNVNPKIKLLCAEQIEPQNPNWGNLYGYVDIYCPIFFLYDSTQAHWRQSLGDEVWTYTACTQGSVPTPWWQLDMPLLNYRIVPWQLRYYSISGLLYWSTNYWQESEDPWTKPAGFRNSRGDLWNEDGCLFYPGYNVGIDGPVTSLRLKQLREGIEDYEYLTTLWTMGDIDFAQSQILRLTTNFFNWQDNPESLYVVRRTIGERIAAHNAVRENDSEELIIKPVKIGVNPNPFFDVTNIKYPTIDTRNDRLKIYNALGKLVRNLKLDPVTAFSSWDGKDNQGRDVAAGVYLVKLESKPSGYTKVILIRP